jgi:hypothetical protein
MTEAEWALGTNTRLMLQHLHGLDSAWRYFLHFPRYRRSGRKLWLFACACIRLVWPWWSVPRILQAVESIESQADGGPWKKHASCSPPTFRKMPEGAACLGCAAYFAEMGPIPQALRKVVNFTAGAYQYAVAPGGDSASLIAAYTRADAVQASFLRDIFGFLPFRPFPPISPAWLTWNGGIVPRLAHAIYENRDLPSGMLDRARLLVLADALEEAGCTDAALLDHCRSEGPHLRGCWPVDLLLGKK